MQTDELDARIFADALHETAVPVGCRRGAFQSHDFDNGAAMACLSGHKVAHLPAYFHVVRPDEGRVCTVCAAVEKDNGNAFLHGFVDNGRDGVYLIGRNDQQVYAFFDELFYLSDLQRVVVIGRSKLQRHLIFGESGRLELLVQLVAPYIFRALRHADDIPLPLFSLAAA